MSRICLNLNHYYSLLFIIIHSPLSVLSHLRFECRELGGNALTTLPINVFSACSHLWSLYVSFLLVWESMDGVCRCKICKLFPSNGMLSVSVHSFTERALNSSSHWTPSSLRHRHCSFILSHSLQRLIFKSHHILTGRFIFGYHPASKLVSFRTAISLTLLR